MMKPATVLRCQQVQDERAEEGSEWDACDTQQAWEPRRAGRLLRWSPGWHTLLEPRPLPECYFFGGWRASGLPQTAAVSPRAPGHLAVFTLTRRDANGSDEWGSADRRHWEG